MTLRSQSLFLLACAVGSIASPVVHRDAVASSTSIAPAATSVSTDSSAGVDLFDVEAIQLTDEVVKGINVQANDTDLRALIDFENNTNTNVAALSRRSGVCKVFPGDWNYPKSAIWSLFDLLLGGALIKTTPVAAPCYRSSGIYDETKCADISARFTTADLQ